MAPNLRPIDILYKEDFDDSVIALKTPKKEKTAQDELTEMLDKQADTNGLSNINYDNEDWTDVKHSERKKRDRILDDGVLIGLMKKSDTAGFIRLFMNLGMMALTATAIHHLDIFPVIQEMKLQSIQSIPMERLAIFVPLYFFYGFQFQCFAFAGQHEFLHRNAFKTKWINDVCLFFTGVFCFELGEHERVMHKQHHTYTNNIDKDPELTSYYSRQVLENPAFRNLPTSRWGYFRQFFDIFTTFKCRVGRIVFSAMGIAVDYSGTGWSLKDFNYSNDSGIMQTIQRAALLQLTIYAAVIATMVHSPQGTQAVLFWWIVPVLLGYPMVNYVRNLEHADCDVTQEQPNCLLNTRSVRTNLLVRTLLWDTNFHAEHHCYPMVPFYNLHKINELMYPYVVHNECDHFTTQNWAAVKPNGWIAKQEQTMAAAAVKEDSQTPPRQQRSSE